jgi:hypothetical protein
MFAGHVRGEENETPSSEPLCSLQAVEKFAVVSPAVCVY